MCSVSAWRLPEQDLDDLVCVLPRFQVASRERDQEHLSKTLTRLSAGSVRTGEERCCSLRRPPSECGDASQRAHVQARRPVPRAAAGTLCTPEAMWQRQGERLMQDTAAVVDLQLARRAGLSVLRGAGPLVCGACAARVTARRRAFRRRARSDAVQPGHRDSMPGTPEAVARLGSGQARRTRRAQHASGAAPHESMRSGGGPGGRLELTLGLRSLAGRAPSPCCLQSCEFSRCVRLRQRLVGTPVVQQQHARCRMRSEGPRARVKGGSAGTTGCASHQAAAPGKGAQLWLSDHLKPA